jgi:hypothetical protein
MIGPHLPDLPLHRPVHQIVQIRIDQGRGIETGTGDILLSRNRRLLQQKGLQSQLRRFLGSSRPGAPGTHNDYIVIRHAFSLEIAPLNLKFS